MPCSLPSWGRSSQCISAEPGWTLPFTVPRMKPCHDPGGSDLRPISFRRTLKIPFHQCTPYARRTVWRRGSASANPAKGLLTACIKRDARDASPKARGRLSHESRHQTADTRTGKPRAYLDFIFGPLARPSMVWHGTGTWWTIGARWGSLEPGAAVMMPGGRWLCTFWVLILSTSCTGLPTRS